MAFKLAELYTDITVRGLDKSKQGVDGLKKSLDKASVSGSNVAAGLAAAFAAAGYASINLLKRASDAEEQLSKFKVVFKEQSAAAEEFANTLATRTNRSIFDLRKFLAGIQDTFVPLGFAREEARKLSQQVVELAVDLGSFNNLGTEEVMRDIQSALVGNSETVRKYGVVLTEANIKQRALNDTGKKAEKQLTNQEKTAARLALIMEGTADAQGDAERTAGSLANTWRGVAAQAEEIAVQMGGAMAPAALEVLGTINELLPTFKELFGTAGEGTKFIKSVAEGVAILTRNLAQLADTPGVKQLNELRKWSIEKIGTSLADSGTVDAKGNFATTAILDVAGLPMVFRDLVDYSKSTAKSAKDFAVVG